MKLEDGGFFYGDAIFHLIIS